MQDSNNITPDSSWAIRTHEEMKDVLMSPASSGPNIHYYMIRGGSQKKNITVLESGMVGQEYMKAYGHYHIDKLSETYTVLSGTGIVLTQERKIGSDGAPINDEVSYIKAIFIKKGSFVVMPPTAGHLIINTGEDWLITSDDSPVAMTEDEKASWPVHADYEPIKKLHGFAYYVVNENGTPNFVKNEHYKNTPEIILEQE